MDGVEIKWMDDERNVFTTGDGDQSGSNFEIIYRDGFPTESPLPIIGLEGISIVYYIIKIQQRP